MGTQKEKKTLSQERWGMNQGNSCLVRAKAPQLANSHSSP